MLGNFADVQQAIGAGKQLDEGAELGEPHYLAEIGLANFGGGSDFADHLQRGVGGSAVGGEDVHLAVVQHVDLDASGLNDRADLLSARPAQVADFVGGDG